MPKFTMLEEFQTIRDKYKTALDDLMILAMEKVNPQVRIYSFIILFLRTDMKSSMTVC